MYKCERCNSQYMGLAMLRQHCRDVHGDQKYYKCHVCGKLFSHPSSRNIHLRLHSGEKPYKCSTCGKQFRVSSHLKDHVRVHTGKLTYRKSPPSLISPLPSPTFPPLPFFLHTQNIMLLHCSITSTLNQINYN